MSRRRRRCDQRNTGLQLRRFPRIIFKTECRIAADLAQPHELGKHFQFSITRPRAASQRLFQFQRRRRIKLLLPPRRRRINDPLLLTRKLPQHILFQAAQDKRSRHPPQCRQCFRILIFHDWQLIPLTKLPVTV